ncbi:hypothetical protein GE061_017473 [Apolygus lucorum]|uniref:lysozyme n=1 Tax=Apolygus lucorum TaxID=248454 RepID=A0A6A4J9Z8_APOLU|nr:hypothetical protein GE061_017473 [Apolygus lucorum]
MCRRAWLVLLLLSLLDIVHLRTYDPCEFAQVLTRDQYNVSFWHIPTWTCLGYVASGLNTSYNQDGYHGLFRISGQHWCGQCNMTCDKLMDDDITDDMACANTIYERHNNIRNSGFRAWGSFYSVCLEPWVHLKDHDCHKFWKFLILRIPKLDHERFLNTRHGETTENILTAEQIGVAFPEANNNTNSTSGHQAEHHTAWAAHHLLVSDAGILILVLLLVFVVAGSIEIWRRYDLPLSNLCP